MQNGPQLLDDQFVRPLTYAPSHLADTGERNSPYGFWVFRLVFASYDFVWGVLIAAWWAFRLIVVASHGDRAFWHRLGYLPSRPQNFPVGVWLHAASVGEWLSALPVLSTLKARRQDCWIQVTTTQRHAFDLACLHPSGADAIGWLPWDFGPCIQRALDRVQPDVLVLVECELWPNLVVRAARRNARVMMMNARIYERDLPRYLLARRFFGPLLRMISHIGAQSQSDRARYIRLGARERNVTYTGNTKFDVAPPVDLESQSGKLRALLPLSTGPLWILASTHHNEEEQILSHCEPLRRRFPNLQILIAPRHVARADEIVTIAERLGLRVVRRSLLAKRDIPSQVMDPPEVIVLDSIGELRAAFALADLVFVGGSLVKKGGQNPIEPCAQSKATLIGPHVYHFEEIVAAFLADRAVVSVRDVDDLLVRAHDLLADAWCREELGRRASAVVRRHRGAAEVYARMLERCVQGASAAEVAFR